MDDDVEILIPAVNNGQRLINLTSKDGKPTTLEINYVDDNVYGGAFTMTLDPQFHWRLRTSGDYVELSAERKSDA